jgi:MarR family transcriptional regulator, organic hydroperoxide resistance regulator
MSGTRTDPKAALDRIVETTIYLNTESRRIAREQCTKLGITATQLNVIKLLQTVGDLSLSELSKKMAATNSTVTGIVDRMVAAELVQREQSADDRRVWKIKLTAHGRALAKKIDVAPWEMLRQAVMALPADERAQLIATLDKIANHVEKSAAQRSQG